MKATGKQLTLIGIVVAAAPILVYSGMWVGEMNAHKKTTEKAISDTSKWAIGVNEHKSRTEAFMADIRIDIKEVHKDIKRIFLRLPPQTTTTGSPLRLTPLGEAISKRLGAKEWAKEVAPRLLDRTKGKTRYDIQKIAFEYVKGPEFVQTENTRRAIKDAAYDNGIDEQLVLDVLGVELRNAILELQVGADSIRSAAIQEPQSRPHRLSDSP